MPVMHVPALAFLRMSVIALLSAGQYLPVSQVHAAELRSHAAVRIELHDAPALAHQNVRLGDVAYVSASSYDIVDRLVALPLGKLALNGASSQLGRETMLRWIRSEVGIDEGSVSLTGPAVVAIRLAQTKVSGAEIAKAAREHLAGQIKGLQQVRSEITQTSFMADVVVPGGVPELRARAEIPLSRRVRGTAVDFGDIDVPPFRQTVWVDLWSGAIFQRSVPVSFEVRTFGPALVAAQPLEAGKVVDPNPGSGQLRLVQNVELTSQRSSPVMPSAATVAGPQSVSRAMRLTRPLRSGEILAKGDVEIAPVVARGEQVRVRISVNGIELEESAEALEDGREGQRVHVRLTNAASVLVAKVTAPGILEVQP